MGKKVIAWTDASVKSGWGIAIAFHATVIDGYETRRVSSAKYIDQEIITTRAEYLGCMYAACEMFHNLDAPQEFNFILYCDSQGTVDKIQRDATTNKLERVLDFYTEKFNTFNVGWVSRQMNEEADVLAKAELEKGNR